MTFTTLAAVIILLLALGLAAALYFLFKKTAPAPLAPTDQTPFLLMQQQMQDLARLIDQKLADTHKGMQETRSDLNKTIQAQFGQSMKVITDVTERLTKLDETNKQVMGFTEQLESLQQTLQNPKQRGILGEYYLENVLKNVLPPGGYEMQYKFSDGDIVDAVVFVKDKIIPVDSKFSLENYNRAVEEKDPTRKQEYEDIFKQDLKKRIDETSKYIKPKENTLDFAFMFIPAEGIYYDLLINKVGALKVNTNDLIDYAFKERHVIIVSPTSFLAYLQTVLQGLRALQIEESVQGVIKRIGDLSKHLLAYDSYMKKLGSQLGTVVGTYNTAAKEYTKIDKDIARIAGSEKTIEPLLLEKPILDEE